MNLYCTVLLSGVGNVRGRGQLERIYEVPRSHRNIVASQERQTRVYFPTTLTANKSAR